MSADSLSRKDKVSSTVNPQRGRFSTNILGDNMSSECFTPRVKFYTLRERPKSRQPQRVATMGGKPHFSLKKSGKTAAMLCDEHELPVQAKGLVGNGLHNFFSF